MKKRIRILIHFDGMQKPVSSIQMAEYMESLANIIMPENETFSERVEIQPNNTRTTIILPAQDAILPLRFRERVSDSICHISIFFNNIRNERACLFGCIIQSHYLATKMIANEQTINILIDETMWEYSQNRIFSRIIELCRNTSISYVAADKETIAPQSIYHAQLRFFSQREAISINPETKVPGIYWTQYISTKMLSNETLNDICNLPSPASYTKVEGKQGDGVWIQTSSRINDDTKELHKVLYSILKRDSYSLDSEKVLIYARTLPWLFEKNPF